MTLWFLFLGGTGLFFVFQHPAVLLCLNPLRGVGFLLSPNNHAGIMILGSCFLATTGAEALYSDMGHVGRGNIYATWPFVKCCLLLSYMGQGAWLISNAQPRAHGHRRPQPVLPDARPGLRPFAVGLSTVAAIIASQALITGAFSLVSEASRLDLMPHMQVFYPAETKGQLYIPMVNNVMLVGCVIVVLLFQNSAHMEAAYGLAITLTMMCTTLLLFFYLHEERKLKVAPWIFAAFFLLLEGFFFVSSCSPSSSTAVTSPSSWLHSSWALWCAGTTARRSSSAQFTLLPLRSYSAAAQAPARRRAYERLSDNIVYLTKDTHTDYIDRDIVYSILDKHPKRARAWWFVNVDTDEPYTLAYSVETFGTDYVFRVHLYLGYKINQRVNAYLRQVVQDLAAIGELPPQHRTYSIYETRGNVGDFRFCMLRKMLAPETDINRNDHRVMAIKYAVRRACGSPARWYGLENSAIIIEYVPLFARMRGRQTCAHPGAAQVQYRRGRGNGGRHLLGRLGHERGRQEHERRSTSCSRASPIRLNSNSTDSRAPSSTTPTSNTPPAIDGNGLASHKRCEAVLCRNGPVSYERRGSGTTSLSGLAPSASIRLT